MVRIKCVNAACTCPDRSFIWDDSADGGIAQPGAPGAARVPAVCPCCNTTNYVWVKHPRQDDVIRKDLGVDEEGA